MIGPLRTGKPKVTARRRALSKSPPPPEPSRLRQWLMASTMLTPVDQGALAEWLWFDQQGISFRGVMAPVQTGMR